MYKRRADRQKQVYIHDVLVGKLTFRFLAGTGVDARANEEPTTMPQITPGLPKAMHTSRSSFMCLLIVLFLLLADMYTYIYTGNVMRHKLVMLLMSWDCRPFACLLGFAHIGTLC